MIDPKNISFTELLGHPAENFTRTFQARLLLRADYRVDGFEFRTSAGLAQAIKERLAGEIWHHVYGDLRKPSYVLEQYARKNSNFWPGSFEDAELQEAIAAMRRVHVWR